MKTNFLRKGILHAFTAMTLALFTISCNKDDSNDIETESYTTSGNASGSQQSPPTSSSGTATHSGTYNTQTNVWNYTINWTSLSSAATIVELRGPANIGANGTLLFSLNISASGVNGSASGSAVLTDEQEVQLLAGRLYYTILTAANVTGEIRGQITATARN